MMRAAMNDRRYTSLRMLIPALILGILMTVAFVFSSSNVYAVDENGFYDGGTAYKYKVTVYSGLEGTYKGQEKWSVELDAGSDLELDLADVQIKDNKYYPRGFRVTGHDNDENLNEPSGSPRIPITNLDADYSYEVAWGMKGNMVAYTVRYVDEDGKKLRENDTYYGMPGDKPVVAYRYVEGYVPNVYSQAKTLSTDESKNVFTFTYSEGETVTTTTTTTVTQTVPGARPPGTPGNPAGTRVPAAAVPGTGAPGGNDGAGTTIGDGDTPLAGPDQYADLDDDGTPMAGPDGEGGSHLPLFIGLGVGILLLIALIIYLLMRRRAESEETDV